MNLASLRLPLLVTSLLGSVAGGGYLLTKAIDIGTPDVAVARRATGEAQKGYPSRLTVLVKVRLGFFAGTNVMSPEEQALRAYPTHVKVISCKAVHGGVYEVILERP